MKKFTQARILSVSLCLLLVAMLFVSSCTSPQHFSFSPAPASYQKVKKTPEVPAFTEEETAVLTASIAEEPIVLPEIAALKKEVIKTKAPEKTQNSITQTTQKLNLAQKVVFKKLQKQVTKLSKKSQNTNQVKETAAGPVTNRSAIALILIGLVVAILGGLISKLLATLGILIVIIGLILLILNYV